MTFALSLIGAVSAVATVVTFLRALTHSRRELNCRFQHKRKTS